jgi:hypothetical protein
MRQSLVAAYTAHWKIAVSASDGGGLIAIRPKDGKPIPEMARVSRQGQRREDFLFDFCRQRAMRSG